MFLAVDLSEKHASLALGKPGEVVEWPLGETPSHLERLVPEIDAFLRHHHRQLSDVEKFLITVGPGSYTGLRIGISTIKAFCQALQKPVVAMASSEVKIAAWYFETKPELSFPAEVTVRVILTQRIMLEQRVSIVEADQILFKAGEITRKENGSTINLFVDYKFSAKHLIEYENVLVSRRELSTLFELAELGPIYS